MTQTAGINSDLRDQILASPEDVLEDPDLMRALIVANERALGSNVVDLRGIAMERLESRLDRLEDTHRSVIAAAYDNLSGTNQIHRAVLSLLEPAEFEDFLANLKFNLTEILRVNALRLVLETMQDDADPVLGRLGDVLYVAKPGYVDSYLTGGRNTTVRPVILRQVQTAPEELFGETANWIRSEACLRLDFGPGRLPGMLVLGAEDPHQFSPSHGTDLLTFFAGVFERSMRRWLA
jgi:uncharacterized protein YigA (DUF484 family)